MAIGAMTKSEMKIPDTVQRLWHLLCAVQRATAAPHQRNAQRVFNGKLAAIQAKRAVIDPVSKQRVTTDCYSLIQMKSNNNILHK